MAKDYKILKKITPAGLKKNPESMLGWVPREAITNLKPKARYVAGLMSMPKYLKVQSSTKKKK
jgi:hypothetical protein